MKRTHSTKSNEHGFTLLEVVVSIMVAAILGTLMYQYSQSTLLNTTVPITWLNNTQKLNSVMESIRSDYADKLANPATPPTGWIESFGADMETKYQSEVGSISSNFGYFDSNVWTTPTPCSDSNCRHVKITLYEGKQSVIDLFSE